MPHHKSAEKRVGTNELRRQRNVAATTRMKTAIKAVRGATTRAAGETASRHKSRLAKFVQKLPA